MLSTPVIMPVVCLTLVIVVSIGSFAEAKKCYNCTKTSSSDDCLGGECESDVCLTVYGERDSDKDQVTRHTCADPTFGASTDSCLPGYLLSINGTVCSCTGDFCNGAVSFNNAVVSVFVGMALLIILGYRY